MGMLDTELAGDKHRGFGFQSGIFCSHLFRWHRVSFHIKAITNPTAASITTVPWTTSALLPLLLPVGVAEALVLVPNCDADWWPLPAVLSAGATELRGELVADPWPKSDCVTETGLELVDDPWPASVAKVAEDAEAEEAGPPVVRGFVLVPRVCAERKPTTSAWKATMKNRILTH